MIGWTLLLPAWLQTNSWRTTQASHVSMFFEFAASGSARGRFSCYAVFRHAELAEPDHCRWDDESSHWNLVPADLELQGWSLKGPHNGGELHIIIYIASSHSASRRWAPNGVITRISRGL